MIRFVVDEASLDLDALDAQSVGDALRRLSQVLLALRRFKSEATGIISGWGGVPCWRGGDLASVLSVDQPLDRDDRLLLLGLLNKCVHIDDDAESLNPEVSVDGSPYAESYGIALSHEAVCGTVPECRAVISLAHLDRCGLHTVTRDDKVAEVVFVVDAADERWLWRAAYELEDISEASFFQVARRAFPSLTFFPTLSFTKFEGSYRSVRAEVVRHLGALNDDWTPVYSEMNGNAEQISTRIGIDVSRESSRTRASERVMRLRDVELNGQGYRCEWHSKLGPHRNRIHFHPGDESLGGPLIGIFCDHLDT